MGGYRVVGGLVAVLLAGCLADADDVGFHQAELRGGTAVPTGSLEAVVTVGACSGTLITDDTVLSAAHCVCGSSASTYTNCLARTTVIFRSVRRNGSSVRENVGIPGDVIVHPLYYQGGWLYHDFALIKLDELASNVVEVPRIRVETPSNQVSEGDTMTFVGYGPTHAGNTTNCNGGNAGVKRQASSVLDEYRLYGDPVGARLVFYDNAVGACPGDSGGPALNGNNRVVGVASYGNAATNSAWDSTHEIWPWLGDNACPVFDPVNRRAGFCSDPLCQCVSAEGDCDRDSHCKINHQCVNNVGAASGLPGHYDVCWAGEYLVTLYDGSNYNGASQAFPVGTWPAAKLNEVGDNRASSVDAAPGFIARVCTVNGGSGLCQDIAGRASLTGGALNNQVSNLEVLPGVSVYSDTSYFGATQTFAAGSYGPADFTGIGDNQITSLIAAPGMSVRLCANSDGSGDCQNYGDEVGHVGSALDNRASYIEVHPGVTVYAGADYQGLNETFPPGTYDAADFAAMGDDQIRSLVAAPDVTVRVCTGTGLTGECQDFTRWVPDIGRALAGDVSSLQVIP